MEKSSLSIRWTNITVSESHLLLFLSEFIFRKSSNNSKDDQTPLVVNFGDNFSFDI